MFTDSVHGMASRPVDVVCALLPMLLLTCRLWKVFSVWRRAIRDLKSISSTEKLSKGLLLLDPQLQQAVYAGRAACLEVEAVQLSCLVPGQALTLLEYAEAHAAQLDRCQAHLAQVS